MQRQQHRVRQRPTESCRGQTEGRWRRQDNHFAGIDAAREHRPDAVMKRIAGGEHADLAPAVAADFVGGAIKGTRPSACRAANKGRRKRKMTPTAEDDVGSANQRAGCRTQTIDPVFAYTDDGQPARRCCTVR